MKARQQRTAPARALVYSGDAVLGLPLFAYGAVVNALPYLIPRWLARRTARKETDYATTRLLASIVAYPLFWGLQTWIVAQLLGRHAALLFALSLPISGVIAYRYLVGPGRFLSRLRVKRCGHSRSAARAPRGTARSSRVERARTSTATTRGAL